MGTNFLMLDASRQQIRHLGKRSAGWQFLFRAYPALGITGASSWRGQLDGAEWIRDEYGNRYTAAEMIAITQECRDGKPHALHGTDYADEDGSAFCATEFC